MLVEPDYRGFRIEVTAQLVEGAWSAEIQIRSTLLGTQPVVLHHMFPLTVAHVERRAILLGKDWVDQHSGAR